MVSGRDDAGFFTRTTTVLCEEYEELGTMVQHADRLKTWRSYGGPERTSTRS